MKGTLTIVEAYNGAEILTFKPVEYVHTKFDDIISEWNSNRSGKTQEKGRKMQRLKILF